MIPYSLLEIRKDRPPESWQSLDLRAYETTEWRSEPALRLEEEPKRTKEPRIAPKRTRRKRVHPRPNNHFLSSLRIGLVRLARTHGRNPPHV